MGIDLFDVVSYPVWKLALMLFAVVAVSHFTGWFLAYEKFNERKR